jgi:hypothetical protein
LFKLERYTRAFLRIKTLMMKNIDVWVITLVTTLVFIVFLATAMWHFEKDGIDEDTVENHATLGDALWATFLESNGEFPWSDFTPPGQAILALLALVSIALFAVPVSLFADGFQDMLTEEMNAREEALRGSLTHEGGRHSVRQVGDLTAAVSDGQKRAWQFLHGKPRTGLPLLYSWAFTATVATTSVITMA